MLCCLLNTTWFADGRGEILAKEYCRWPSNAFDVNWWQWYFRCHTQLLETFKCTLGPLKEMIFKSHAGADTYDHFTLTYKWPRLCHTANHSLSSSHMWVSTEETDLIEAAWSRLKVANTWKFTAPKLVNLLCCLSSYIDHSLHAYCPFHQFSLLMYRYRHKCHLILTTCWLKFQVLFDNHIKDVPLYTRHYVCD